MLFLHGAILITLVALVVPPIVHLLSRRRVVIVDWAAMQFLQTSRQARRTVMFEHMLLMLLRMALLAGLIIAAALPVLRLSCMSRLPGGDSLASLAGQSNRDIVLIIDGSDSMEAVHDGKTAQQNARDWAEQFVKGLPPGDRVALIQAKQRPILVLDRLSANRQEVLGRLEQWPKPRGSVDWARSILEAQRLFEGSPHTGHEIVILSDGQRHGWADGTALGQWQAAASPAAGMARVWVVNTMPDRPGELPNWSLTPLIANRTVATAGREVVFRFELQSRGTLSPPPAKVELFVDNRSVGTLAVPQVREPSIALEFKHSFAGTGSHLVSVRIPDDAMPGDNRQDYAIDVLPAIPVLIVDGEPAGGSAGRRSDFVRYAIAPPGHPQPSFVVKAIGVNEFGSQTLTQPLGTEFGTLPRVLILQNVGKLSAVQHRAIEEFIARGNGVLLLPGLLCDSESFNRLGHRDGDGWLPARLLSIGGDDSPPDKAALPLPDGLDQTFLELFKKADAESLLKSSFTHWWKLAPANATTVARLNTGDPLFVEKLAGRGRVLQVAIPFDDTWKNDLLRSHDFVRLCHECLFHLAGSRSNDANLKPGQPLVYRPNEGEPTGTVTVFWPDGRQKRYDVASEPLTVDDTREPGAYRMADDSGRQRYAVVQADPGESNLIPCTETDRQVVANQFPEGKFRYENQFAIVHEGLRDGVHDPEIGGLLLLFVMALLLAELALTRSVVRKNPPVDF